MWDKFNIEFVKVMKVLAYCTIFSAEDIKQVAQIDETPQPIKSATEIND